MRADAHSALALQLDDSARVFDSTSLALASDHQASTFESTILVVLKISSSRTCSRTVRLVIFTTDLHGVVSLREYVDTVAPLPTVDVMAVIVDATWVTRQDPHKASKACHIKIKERHCADKLKGPEGNTNGWSRKNNMRTPCVKNLCKDNKRTTGAEETQNQHCQRVLTVVDTFGTDSDGSWVFSLSETFPTID